MNEIAPRIVTALSRDVFFGMRIRTILQQLGYEIKLIPNEADLVDASEDAAIALIDFNGEVDWDVLKPLIESDVPTVGFCSHTKVDAFRAAKEAGLDRVVSNGEFSRRLPELLEKYAR